MDRLLIVSNRLPVTVTSSDGEVRLVPSAGGLATGLRGPHEKSNGLWIGWPGEMGALSDRDRADVEGRLREARTLPVHLSSDEVRRYYGSFSNSVLWPLFHYQLERVPTDAGDWDAYRAVNERFADAVAEVHRPGDMIWVHDYQLMLVPALLRQRIPDARIGFFLHIPFPSSETFRTLPWRAQILEGLLGADLVGFHAFTYVRHFTTSLLNLLGIEAREDVVTVDGHDTRLGVFPMGIDAKAFETLARDEDVRRATAEIRESAAGQRILLGIDRLDYTKGIPRRLTAFERLLERRPELKGHVRLLQLAVPSREEVGAYAETRARVEEMVGGINGRLGTPVWTPIHYVYRSLTARDVVALYKSADVMLVTPLRDGMNLVAKEFVASRDDEDGVLVLSEFAGAAAELGDATSVNPFDVDGVADAIGSALDMPPALRKARMRSMRRRVMTHDVHEWVTRFTDALSVATRAPHPQAPAEGLVELKARIVAAARPGRLAVLLLDYDGTLVPTARKPDLASPDGDLRDLLRALAARPSTRVHVVSGRVREDMEAWLGALPIGLHAEHGFWSRASSAGSPWVAHHPLDDGWKRAVRPIFDEFAARTPGAFVEEKDSSLAWHFRLADPEFGVRQARDLRLHLINALSNVPVEVLSGDKVVEVRAQGVHKGIVLGALALPEDACIIAMGNDATDEDLFRALPESAITVHVGHGATRAKYRLWSSSQARALLRSLVVP